MMAFGLLKKFSPFLLAFAMQVRKEKLGDRITALQQLVSPFGKVQVLSVINFLSVPITGEENKVLLY
jgi:hypothetical protein